MSLTNAYYNQKSFIKAYLSAFNKKMSCKNFVSFSNENFKEIIKICQQEQLSSSDTISEILYKFPNDILDNQKFLFQELDVNNAFFLKASNHIFQLQLKIDSQVTNIKKGHLVWSNTLNEMYEVIKNVIIFLLDNKITLQHSSDYREMCHVAFTSILKRYVHEKGTKETPIDTKIDNILLYLAVISFDNSDKKIYGFLNDTLLEKKYLVMPSETFDYAFCVLENCQSVFLSTHSEYLKEYCTKIYVNAIITLSFVKHETGNLKIIIDSLLQALDPSNTKIHRQLFEAINIFLVQQLNRFEQSLETETLDLLRK